MKRNFKHIAIASFLTCTLLNGQDNKIKKAQTDFNDHAYAEAIESYESLVKKGYTSAEIFENLGDANYQNANYRIAADWYAKLLELDSIKMEADYFYKYAQTLKSYGKYEESDQWMLKFESINGHDNRAIKFAGQLNYLDEIKANSGRYHIENLTINSRASDFAPSLNGEELVFSSARDTGRISRHVHTWNNKAFTNLYRSIPSGNSHLNSVKKLSKPLNRKTHESSTVFTKDGTTVYFTRNSFEHGSFIRDNEGVSRLKIYRAHLKDGKWSGIIELPFNDDSYSAAHPTLSADEKKLYFASDMPGSLGQSDIFVVDIHSDGSFGTPENLGNKVNTEGRETFPFVTKNEVLYYASDGHPGLGGLDIFAVKIDEMCHSQVVNVGEPINSKQDDFSFIINETTKKGYFASNREGGHGDDDIYSFTEIKEIDLNRHNNR